MTGNLAEKEFQSDRKTGLDYLSFWAFGSFQDASELEAKLEDYQLRARENGHEVFVSVNGMQFELLPYGSGKGAYRRKYQLRVGGVYFGICCFDRESDDYHRPNLKVEIKGKELLHLGEHGALQVVRNVYQYLGFVEDKTKVSRTDIRADFASFSVRDIRDCFERGQAVARAKKFKEIRGEAFRRVESFYIGVREGENTKGVFCRVYDKFEEMKRHADRGASIRELILEGADVEQLTRLEFELHREALGKRYNVETVEDLLGQVESIADDLTKNWIRIHRSRVTDGNQAYGKDDEGTYHKIWRVVRDSFRQLGSMFERKVPRTPEVKEQSVERQARAAFGYLAKVAVYASKEIGSWRDFFQLVDEKVVTDLEEFRVRVAVEKKKRESRRLNSLLNFFEDVGNGLDPGPDLQAAFEWR